jgi:hypothetical protein
VYVYNPLSKKFAFGSSSKTLNEIKKLLAKNGTMKKFFDNQTDSNDCLFRCIKFVAKLLDGYNWKDLNWI